MISKIYKSFSPICARLKSRSCDLGQQGGQSRLLARHGVRPIDLRIVAISVGIFVGCVGKENAGSHPSSEKRSALTLFQAWGIDQKTWFNSLRDLGNETVPSYEAKSAPAEFVQNIDFQNLEIHLKPSELSLLRHELNQEIMKPVQERYAREIWQSLSIDPAVLSIEEIEKAQKEMGDWLKVNLTPEDHLPAIFLVDPDEKVGSTGGLSTFDKLKSSFVSGWQLLQLRAKLGRLKKEQDPIKGLSQLTEIALSPETYKTLAQNSEKIAVASELADKFVPHSKLAENLKTARTLNQYLIGPASQAINMVKKVSIFIGPPRESSFGEP